MAGIKNLQEAGSDQKREAAWDSGSGLPVLSGDESLIGLSEPQARGFIDISLALEHRILPLQVFCRGKQKVLRAATVSGATAELRQQLAFACGMPVELVAVDGEMLNDAIIRAYLGDEGRLVSSVEDLARYGSALADRSTQSASVSSAASSSDNEVVRFVRSLIEYAIAHEASDIHIGARRGGSSIQLRIGGELRNHAHTISTLEVHHQLVSRIKVMAGLDITERMHSQEGRIRYPLSGRMVDIRVSIMPTVHGENVVLRVFGKEQITPLSDVGLASGILEELQLCMKRCRGAIVAAGPTGSGKTSTLYAVLACLKGELNILTLEDPVEIIIDGIVQSSICEAAGFGFAEGLRAALRQDPDVLLIGELRESRAATAAFEAALSGHLMLSSIHAGSVIEGIMRLEQLGVSRSLIAQGMSLLIAQRLLRRLCPACRVFDLRAAQAMGCDVFKPVGCARCSYAGYSGQTLVAEALVSTDRVREYIRHAGSFSEATLSDAAGSAYWGIRDQLLGCLERGEIGYQQYLDELRD